MRIQAPAAYVAQHREPQMPSGTSQMSPHGPQQRYLQGDNRNLGVLLILNLQSKKLLVLSINVCLNHQMMLLCVSTWPYLEADCQSATMYSYVRSARDTDMQMDRERCHLQQPKCLEDH